MTSRVTSVKVGTTRVATYAYLGVQQVVLTNLEEAGVVSLVGEFENSGSYPGLDRFNRVTSSRWTKDLTTDRDFYDVDVKYDRNSNVDSVVDNIHNSIGGGGGSRLFDLKAINDNLNRLTSFRWGNWNGSTLSNEKFEEAWTLGQTGNWNVHQLDRIPSDGTWELNGSAGGSGPQPARDRPWVNLGGWWGVDLFCAGGDVKGFHENIDRVGATGFAIDAGVQYSNLGKIDGLSIGVAVKNIGPAMQYGGSGLNRISQPANSDRGPSPYQIVAQKDELPTTLELGLSYALPIGSKDKLLLTSLFQDNNFQENVGRFGAEYNFRDLFFLRGGYSISPEDAVGKGAYIYGLTLGAGLHYDFTGLGIDVNYAYRDLAFFSASNVLSVSLGF